LAKPEPMLPIEEIRRRFRAGESLLPQPKPTFPTVDGESILDAVARQFPNGMHVGNNSFHQEAVNLQAIRSQHTADAAGVRHARRPKRKVRHEGNEAIPPAQQKHEQQRKVE
jgi:hypothetical protein